MKNITIIYWSSTGNTKLMAETIAEGSRSGKNGQEVLVNLKHVSEASKEDIISADVLALGCSAMGSEGIDDDEMSPYINSIKDQLKDKATLLFGSFDWGNGEWIEDWGKDMKTYGAKIIAEHLKVNIIPDQDSLNHCKSYGGILQSYVLE